MHLYYFSLFLVPSSVFFGPSSVFLTTSSVFLHQYLFSLTIFLPSPTISHYFSLFLSNPRYFLTISPNTSKSVTIFLIISRRHSLNLAKSLYISPYFSPFLSISPYSSPSSPFLTLSPLSSPPLYSSLLHLPHSHKNPQFTLNVSRLWSTPHVGSTYVVNNCSPSSMSREAYTVTRPPSVLCLTFGSQL